MLQGSVEGADEREGGIAFIAGSHNRHAKVARWIDDRPHLRKIHDAKSMIYRPLSVAPRPPVEIARPTGRLYRSTCIVPESQGAHHVGFADRFVAGYVDQD